MNRWLRGASVLAFATLTQQSVPAAQNQAEARLAFDVASIRENTGASDGGRVSWSTGRFVAEDVPLYVLILMAYEVREHQLVGLPAWARTSRFSIAATYAEGQPSEAHVLTMVRTLLAERFGLAVHRETRDRRRYRLVLARSDGKLGPRLVRGAILDCGKYLKEGGKQIGAGGPSPLNPGGQRPQCLMIGRRGWLSGGSQTMRQIANNLQIELGEAVIDDTGLDGTYNIDLEWTPSIRLGDLAVPDTDDRVSIFTAVQEQLGLRLVAEEGPLEMLVVDALSQPTPN